MALTRQSPKCDRMSEAHTDSRIGPGFFRYRN